MTDENYFKLFAWMGQLGLTENELLAYVVIYAFCQKDSYYFGSTYFLSNFYGWSRTKSWRTLKSLCKNGFLRASLCGTQKVYSVVKGIETSEEETENAQVFQNCNKRFKNETSVAKMKQSFQNCNKKNDELCFKNETDCFKNETDCFKIETNHFKIETQEVNKNKKELKENKNIYSENSPEKEIERSVSKKPKKKKRETESFGEFQNVKLTKEEHERLIAEYGNETTEAVIKYLDWYIEEKHYKSENHNLAIRRWVLDAVNKQAKTNNNRSYKPQTTAERLNDDYAMIMNWANKETEKKGE